MLPIPAAAISTLRFSLKSARPSDQRAFGTDLCYRPVFLAEECRGGERKV
jgi:hypothetical protein